MSGPQRGLHLLEVGVRWPPETFVGWKLKGLAARGMRVTVASRSVFDPAVRLPGVELLELPPRDPRLRAVVRACWSVLLRSPRRLAKLVRAVRRAPPELRRRYGTGGLLSMCLPLALQRPDVVHFEWHGVAVDFLPLFDVWGCPVVTSCRGSDISVYPYVPGREHYAACLPEVLRRASAVHCVSDSLKRDAVELGLDPAKARVVRPADDPELFQPAPELAMSNPACGDGELRIVSVGWLRWEKGHEYALEALRRLLDSGVPARLDIVGAVPEEWQGKSGELERIAHTAADLELDGQVRLHGWETSAQISRRLRASDVLLHASVTEGIPNAIVEAMASGVAVVAARCGGIPEAITDGVEGLLASPRDPDALAAALSRLWRDPALRARMGRAGRAKFMPEFTLEHEHAAFMEMYREVTGE